MDIITQKPQCINILRESKREFKSRIDKNEKN